MAGGLGGRLGARARDSLLAIFLIVAEAAWLLWRVPPEPAARLAIAIAMVGAAGLALLAIAAERAELAGWIEDIDFSDRVLQVPQHFVVGLSTPWEALAPVATVATLLVAFRALLRAEAESPSHRRGRRQRHPDRHRDGRSRHRWPTPTTCSRAT